MSRLTSLGGRVTSAASRVPVPDARRGVDALRGMLARGSEPRPPRVGVVPRIVGALLVVALAAGVVAFWPRGDKVTVTGEFTRAVGLFAGSDVRILGVKVGEVTSVEPAGDHVEVVFEFDGEHPVPADAKAAIIAPSLVSDRYVQLLPAYTSGPRLESGATLGLDRTAVPVELDRISSSLDDLLTALGPEGANKEGALADLLDTGAKNLDGQGQNINTLNSELSAAVATLSGGRQDLFQTVKNLQSFTTMLATNNTQVKQLNGNLAAVSEQLDDERDDLAAALKNLGIALGEISTFVRDNRALLKDDLDKLTSVTTAVAQKRDALDEFLRNAPVALSNLQNAYNPGSGTLDTRANLNFLDDPTLCASVLRAVTGLTPSQLCTAVTEDILNPVLDVLRGLGVNLPLGILSAVPADAATSRTGQSSQTGYADAGAGTAPAAGSAQTEQTQQTGVRVRGADPTLGGLLGGGS